jgi:ubiquinone/menaquinone biosynthesis C-methylase UbiE
MFSESEQYYDDLYASLGKNYSKESEKAHRFILKHKLSKGKLLLDVACGTGGHAGFLSQYYQVEGIDLDPKMLSIARKKHPKIRFRQEDMTSFNLGKHFDVIVCLFSSIGYVRTKSRLQKAIKTMGRHLLPGGVLLIEPWFTAKQWNAGHTHMLTVNQPDLKITRISHASRRGNISSLEFQYLIGTPKGIKHRVEIHEMGLFSHKDYMDAFRAAGLDVTHDPKGLSGRGLYIGRKPLQT